MYVKTGPGITFFISVKGQAFHGGGTEYVTNPMEEEPFRALVAKLLDEHHSNPFSNAKQTK